MNKLSTLSVLPEGCLSEILSITSPRDVCSAAGITKAFKSVADSDRVWERFLPPDYREVIARAAAPVVFGSKKQLYRHLSESYILLDRGYLGFKLEKKSGKKCYMLGAKDLIFYMGEDEAADNTFEWGRLPESRFEDVAIARDAWPLDIRGKIASVMLSGKTTYVAYLVYQTTSDSYGLNNPSHTSVNFLGVWNGSTDVWLHNPWLRTSLRKRAQRKDGWKEVKLGEFYYDGENEGEVEMAFEEYEGFISGFIVEGIELRPK
ncbi:putative phloem protein [Helianthus debilis subsp. tardiflorus]